MNSQVAQLTSAYVKSFAGLPHQAFKGIILSLIESSLMGVFYFLSIYFVNRLGFSVTKAGVIISSYGVGALIGGYLSGRLSDVYSAKLISAISLFSQSFIFYLLIYTINYYSLISIIFILGMATYGFITSNHLNVLHFCKHQSESKIKALNLLSTASNLGISIGAIFIGNFSSYGFVTIFYACSILLFILGCYQLGQYIKYPELIQKNGSIKNDKNKIIPSKIIFLVLISVFFVGSIVSQQSNTYALYVQSHFPTLGIKSASQLFTLNTLIVVLFGTAIGSYFSSHNKILMTGIGAFLIGLGMLILALTSFIPNYSIAIIACIIYTLGEILFFCMVQYICYEASAERKGRGLGLFRSVYAGSRIFGPLAGTFLFQFYNGNLIWLISFLIGSICFFYCTKLKDYFEVP